MATVTTNGFDSKAIEREPIWLVFDVDFTDDTTDTDATLATLPVDTQILAGFVLCKTAGNSGTSDTIDMRAGATQWFTGTTDNGGTANTQDYGATVRHFTVTSSTQSLIAAFDTEGTAPTTEPIVTCAVLVYRPSF